MAAISRDYLSAKLSKRKGGQGEASTSLKESKMEDDELLSDYESGVFQRNQTS